jgi:hypothetical protein
MIFWISLLTFYNKSSYVYSVYGEFVRFSLDENHCKLFEKIEAPAFLPFAVNYRSSTTYAFPVLHTLFLIHARHCALIASSARRPLSPFFRALPRPRTPASCLLSPTTPPSSPSLPPSLTPLAPSPCTSSRSNPDIRRERASSFLLRSRSLPSPLTRSRSLSFSRPASQPWRILPLCGVGEGDGDGGFGDGGGGPGVGGLGEAQEGLHMAPLHVSMVTDVCVALSPSHVKKGTQKKISKVSIW